ncbi:cell envelope integrity protein CreD [Piscinibacter sakaiensis]|uniref:Inner membrane protein CreD n=1 Tax=Piscinibacter sakaiensis TaxID=1547922 RepID=A0A0K8P1K4_PISS1|nr:cell envelope integrity protein CreD [Piscinibacter sakaiensis]GAP36503.1 inner membrane protein CreD [Piscinibacter sakaiensis]
MRLPPLSSKLFTVLALIVALLLPLGLVRNLVAERESRRDDVTAEVARGHAGAQVLAGPVLWVPYTETHVRLLPADTAGGRPREETVTETLAMTIFPQQLDSRVELATDTRWRGLFPVTVYDSTHAGTGRFVWRVPEPGRPGARIALGTPVVLFGISDPRGLHAAPRLVVDGVAREVAPLAPGPLPAPLPLGAALAGTLPQPGAVLEFGWTMSLAGTGSLAWVPLATENTVALRSAWPHPSFGGSFLPRERRVQTDGFEARWRVPALSSQAQQQFLRDAAHPQVWERFAVTLADPVDLYRLTDRATKYAVVFIVLSFAAFLLLELVRRWRIHPVQYLMIGLALIVFYLLLLSLAEHLGFARAYVLAAAACVGLLGVYLRHVLGSARAGLGAGTTFAALYGVLYAILVSEDNALVMGALLLFGVLALAMLATRRLDWYALSAPVGGPLAPPSPPAAPVAGPTTASMTTRA